jgi:hypothetical protein
MHLFRRFRPSPALAVACLALLIALGGTSYAAIEALPRNSVGTVQLKNGAVTARKVKSHSLLASNFKAGQLPAGPAGPAGPQGPAGPAGPAGATIKWALARPDGTIVSQSGGITLAAHPSTGTYILNVGTAVAGKPLLANGAYASDASDQRGETTVGPCGGGTEGRTCPANFNATSHVWVQTRSNSGTPADHAFYVVVFL